MLASSPGLSVDMGLLSGATWIYLAIGLLMAVANMVIAVGLWSLKNWARIAVIVVQSLGVVVSLVQSARTILEFRDLAGQYGVDASFPAPLMCGFLLGFVIQAYIIFWFVANREIFD